MASIDRVNHKLDRLGPWRGNVLDYQVHQHTHAENAVGEGGGEGASVPYRTVPTD